MGINKEIAKQLKDSKSILGELRPVVALPITGSRKYRVYDTLAEAISVAKYFEKHQDKVTKTKSEEGAYLAAKLKVGKAIYDAPSEYMNRYWIEKYHLDEVLEMGYEDVKMLFGFLQQIYGFTAFEILEFFSRKEDDRVELRERLKEKEVEEEKTLWSTATEYYEKREYMTKRMPEVFRINKGEKLQKTKVNRRRRDNSVLK